MRLSLPNCAHLAICHASDIARFRHLIADPSKSSSAAYRFTRKPNLEGTVRRAEPFAYGPSLVAFFPHDFTQSSFGHPLLSTYCYSLYGQLSSPPSQARTWLSKVVTSWDIYEPLATMRGAGMQPSALLFVRISQVGTPGKLTQGWALLPVCIDMTLVWPEQRA